MRTRSFRPIAIAAVVVAVLAGIGALVSIGVMHATGTGDAVVRNVGDAPICEITLDPGIAGREATRVERLGPHDTRRVAVGLGPLDSGGLAVRYRACTGEAWIESARVDPGRTIVLDGTTVREGAPLRREE